MRQRGIAQAVAALETVARARPAPCRRAARGCPPGSPRWSCRRRRSRQRPRFARRERTARASRSAASARSAIAPGRVRSARRGDRKRRGLRRHRSRPAVAAAPAPAAGASRERASQHRVARRPWSPGGAQCASTAHHRCPARCMGYAATSIRVRSLAPAKEAAVDPLGQRRGDVDRRVGADDEADRSARTRCRGSAACPR